jgi:bifunctional non-homologous end joining protein LigD
MTVATAARASVVRESLEVDGRTLSVSSLDKVLFPSTGFRKRELLAYYRAIAPVLVPHLANRALHLGRWPDGVEAKGWMQANANGAPAWLRTHVVTGKKNQTLRFAVLDDLPSLLWAANLGTIELHPFQSTIARADEPRAMVFDLDPGPGCDLRDCATAALALRAALAPLRCFVKTSGVKGLHVLVPLNGGATYADVKPFARTIARDLATAHPGWLTDKMPRAERANRIFIDVSQNDPGKQTVAPYSLRATWVPLVSAPVGWHELETGTLAPVQPRAMLERVERHGDLLAEVLTLRQSL